MMNLLNLYKTWKQEEPARVEALAGAGSNRKYYRLFDASGNTVIGVIGTSPEENRAFVYLSGFFASQGVSVPEILAVDDSCDCYLQTDLGSLSLYDALANGRKNGGKYDDRERELLKRTIKELPKLQYCARNGLDFSLCYPLPEMNREAVMFDLNYFKYCFLKPSGVEFHEMRLEEDFYRLSDDLLDESSQTFLYRDFQARNVMLHPDGSPCFIDYQGGRKGPREYDVASFLWQASAHYTAELREELIQTYLDALQPYETVDSEHFHKRLNLFVLFRTLQVLGAYGLRGYCEHKQYFIDSIPYALDNLRGLLEQEICTYPYLRQILWNLVNAPRFCEKKSDSGKSLSEEKKTVFPKENLSALKIDVLSFSYRKGIPEDPTGNGGGYVFDCRAVHNPGKYEPYKKLTGLDEPVIRFLEDDGEILKFLDSVYTLADAHVERYLQRGFTHLMFCFGCTGGQHRSVYSAQHLAVHLHEKYGIEVHVCHREQGVNTVLMANK